MFRRIKWQCECVWSPSGGSAITATNLSAGNYSISVTDANNCVSTSNVNITQPTAVGVTISTVSASCFGSSNGSASATPSGGTSPYTYSWTPGGTSGSTAAGLGSGNYSVIVTDATGCTSSQSTTVNQPTAINLNFSNTPSSCGVATGSATVVAAGGTGPYGYSWSPIGGNTSFANGLGAGVYTATITDANGCTQSGTTQVNNIGGPTVTLAASSNVSCNGGSDGSAAINVSNGTAPFTYNWSPSGGNTTSATGLSAGNYNVTVSDANNCQSVVNVTITEPPAITLLPATVSATCGATNGSASVAASGGTGGLTYNWIGQTGANTNTLSNIGSGSYTVVVTDATGCSSSQTISVSSIGGATAMLQNSTNVSCNGGANGSATISATGGTLPLTYSWSPSGGNTNSAGGLEAGTYIVTVTDGTGCATSVNVLISEPNPLVVLGSSTPASCNGGADGTISLSVSGGQSPYSFVWAGLSQVNPQLYNLPIGNYSVTVTDANGCVESAQIPVNSATPIALSIVSTDVNCNGAANGMASVTQSGGTPPYTYAWSPSGGNASTASNLSGGNYSITVTDANGCASIDNVVIDEPAALTMIVSPASTLCIGQSTLLEANVSGGISPYTYNWSNGISDSSQTVNPVTSTIYSVSVTDANGCSAGNQSVPVTVNPPLSIIANGPFVICAGDAVNLSSLAQGGDGNYTYTWSNGILTPDQALLPSASSTLSVTVTDGCGTPQASTQVDITVNPMPVAHFGPLSMNGCAPVTVSFNNMSTTTPGSTYLWDFGDNGISDTENPVHTYTEPGIYTVEMGVITAEGCGDSQTIINMINVYENPIAAFTATPPNATILGPDISFSNNSINGDTYVWDFGDGSQFSTDINPAHSYTDTGYYQVTLITTTSNGCVDTIVGTVRIDDDFTIYIPNAFTPNFDNVNDAFNAYGIGWKDFNLYILDRWGLNIYHSTDHEKPWDGTYEGDGHPCQADVYVYKIQVHDTAGKLHSFIGHVSLVR
ncbi:MAG: gliding motility-associated C-terminal domain-containing protein [Bacteroidetes bacterium]|nr:gliding motility-associated C-terminal domain-containing protein [Bacteroidota bacterium]